MTKLPDEIVLGIVGEQIHVGIHETFEGLEVSMNTTNMIEETTRQAARELCIPFSRDISTLGFVIGNAVLGKLAASDGFSIKIGDHFNPREQIEVDLRSPNPQIRDASVQRTSDIT